MKKLLISIFLLLVLLSCATKSDKMFNRVNVNQFYRQSGVVKYILPTLPVWANSSGAASCRRTYQVRYLDIKNIMDSYSIGYADALQTQYQFNKLYQDASQLKESNPNPKEEEGLFFKAIDQVKAGIKPFKRPSFKRVNAIWIDDFMANPKKLKALMSSDDMLEGRPLIISMCLTLSEVSKKMRAHKISTDGVRFLTYEIFSRFNEKGEILTQELLNLDHFRNKGQNYYLYYQNKRPSNIVGAIKYKKF